MYGPGLLIPALLEQLTGKHAPVSKPRGSDGMDAVLEHDELETIPEGFSWGDGRNQEAHSSEVVPKPPAGSFGPPRRRLLALGLVLFVSFGHFIFASAYSLIAETGSGEFVPIEPRLMGALISEAGSLAVLWYVLSGQGRSWKDIGWNFKWMDIPRAVALVFGSLFATYLIWIPVQKFYYSYFGHYLKQEHMYGLLSFGISGFSIAFVCLNPFFEELIVRGYLMSEIFDLGGKGVLAVLISIAVQMSYHLYQGFARGIALTVGFTVYSLYFWKTRRIAPVVLAHFCMNAYSLLRGSF